METAGTVPVTVSAFQRLTNQQREFVRAYVGVANGNATEAAKLANYRGPGKAGAKLKAKEDVRAAIQECYRDADMSTDEVRARLAAMGRASLKDALETVLVVEYDSKGLPCTYDAETGEGIPTKEIIQPNLQKMIDSGLIHMVQELRYNQFGPIVKLTDAQAALDKIARARGMYQPDGGGVQVVIKDLRGIDVEAV